ncbi:MAG: alpha/beta hydrolase [Pseudomonadota bacterium]
MQQTVVLVHGVLMPGKVMSVLARRLQRCGFRALIFDYPTRRRCVSDNARALAQFVRNLKASRVHLVGHSMGGMLILRALQDKPNLPPGRVVLMGSPVQGSRVAQGLCQYRPGRWLLGESAEGGLLEPMPDCVYGREIGVIAGGMPVGVGFAFGGLSGTHDGTVSLAETRVAGATDAVVVKASHTSLIFSQQAARQVCAFLQQGRFEIMPRAG